MDRRAIVAKTTGGGRANTAPRIGRGGTVRILIVAPDVVGVDAVAEVRLLQSWHDVALLHGTVTVGDVYKCYCNHGMM